MMGLDREYRSDDGGRSHLRGIKVGCTVAVGGAEEAIATVLNTCDQDILVLNTWDLGIFSAGRIWLQLYLYCILSMQQIMNPR